MQSGANSVIEESGLLRYVDTYVTIGTWLLSDIP